MDHTKKNIDTGLQAHPINRNRCRIIVIFVIAVIALIN